MLVRSVIYGWGFDFMRPFHIRTVIVIRSYGSFICPFTPKTGFS